MSGARPLRSVCLSFLSASALMTDSSNPSPLMAPMTGTQGRGGVLSPMNPSPQTETSIRAPLRHLQGIIGKVFLEQNRPNTTDTSKAAPPPSPPPQPRSDIPLSTDSDGLLEGMPPVIPSPGYSPRIIRESLLSSPKLPALIEKPRPRPRPAELSSSQTENMMNERLDQAFGLAGAAPQRGAYERRPGSRFGAWRENYPQPQIDPTWRQPQDNAYGPVDRSVGLRSPSLYGSAYANRVVEFPRAYSDPQFDEPRYSNRYVPPYQNQGYEDSWARAPWGGQY